MASKGEKCPDILVKNLSEIVLDILHKLEDDAVVNFISKKAKEMTGDIKINQILGNGMEYLLEKNDHQKLIPSLSAQIKNYILEHHEMVRERVKKREFLAYSEFCR